MSDRHDWRNVEMIRLPDDVDIDAMIGPVVVALAVCGLALFVAGYLAGRWVSLVLAAREDEREDPWGWARGPGWGSVVEDPDDWFRDV